MSAELVISVERNQFNRFDYTLDHHHTNGVVNHRFLHEDEVEAIQRNFGAPKVGLITQIPENEEWKIFTTVAEREGWLNSWQQLSLQERAVYITGHYKIDSLPDVATKLGFDDVREQKIYMCGEPNPVIAHHSDKFQALLEKIETKIIESLVGKGLFPSGDLEWKLRRRMFEVGNAVDKSILEIKGDSQPPASSDQWLDWYRKSEDIVCDHLLNL